MAQGSPSSLSSRLRHGGRSLLYTHPISRSATFQPSGDLKRDPPEVSKETDYELTRRKFNLDTPEGRDAWDAKLGPATPEGRYWERRRFSQDKSARAKKRELRRMERRAAL
jgi:hypothetical protein